MAEPTEHAAEDDSAELEPVPDKGEVRGWTRNARRVDPLADAASNDGTGQSEKPRT